MSIIVPAYDEDHNFDIDATMSCESKNGFLDGDYEGNLDQKEPQLFPEDMMMMMMLEDSSSSMGQYPLMKPPNRVPPVPQENLVMDDQTVASARSWGVMSVATPAGQHSLASEQSFCPKDSFVSAMSLNKSISSFQQALDMLGGTTTRHDSHRESITSNGSLPWAVSSSIRKNSDLSLQRRRSDATSGSDYLGLVELLKSQEETGPLDNNNLEDHRMMQSRMVAPSPNLSNPNVQVLIQKPPQPKKKNTSMPLKTKVPVAAKAKKSAKIKTKSDKTESARRGQQIRALMQAHGTQHVYFGRGEPLRNNPGNIRFRQIIDARYDEFTAANKKRKAEIRKEIEDQVKNDGPQVIQFLMIVEDTDTVELALDEVVDDRVGHTLRDTPKRRATYWSWGLHHQQDQDQQWTPFDSSAGEKLERMYQRPMDKRTEVSVTVDRVPYLIDVTDLTMHSIKSGSQTVFDVRRQEPDAELLTSGQDDLYFMDEDGAQDDSSADRSNGGGSSRSGGGSSPSDRSSSGGRSSSNRGSSGTSGGSQNSHGTASCSFAMAAMSAASLPREEEKEKDSKNNDPDEKDEEEYEISLRVYQATPDEIVQNILTELSVAPSRESYPMQRGMDTEDDDAAPLQAPPRPEQQLRAISQDATLKAQRLRDLEARQAELEKQKADLLQLRKQELNNNKPPSPTIMSKLTKGFGALGLRSRGGKAGNVNPSPAANKQGGAIVKGRRMARDVLDDESLSASSMTIATLPTVATVESNNPRVTTTSKDRQRVRVQLLPDTCG